MTLATVLFKKTAGPFDLLERGGKAIAGAVGATPAAAPAVAPKSPESAPPSAPAAAPEPKAPGFMDQLGDVASKGWEASKDLGNKHLWGDAKGSPYAGGVSGIGDAASKYWEGLKGGHVGTLAGTAGGIGAAALLGHLLFSNKKRRQA